MWKTLAFFLFLQSSAFGQEKLVKDIDFDGKKDTVYIDPKDFRIVCRLSTQSFKKLTSKPSEMSNDNTHVGATRNGFEFRNPWMRGGYAVQFRYEKVEKRIRAIGITEYNFGGATNDGSGEASANLLTGDYIGSWHYFDHLANNEKGELVKIPTIKTKIQFKKTYLEQFDGETYYTFFDQFRPIVEKHEFAEREKRSRNPNQK